jgi:hypothetical protein
VLAAGRLSVAVSTWFTPASRPGRRLSGRPFNRAGPGAVLSYETAAELFRLTDQRSSSIHVTIGKHRRLSAIEGVVVHHSGRLAEATHPTLEPPRTRLEETVLDLVECANDFDAAFGLISAACQRRLTIPAKLVDAMGKRAKMRWRHRLETGLAEIGDGIHSVFEYRYVQRVERPHGLPAAARQAKVAADGRNRYLDNLYEDYGLCVELDGLLAHPDEQRWQDQRRANAITAQGMVILRFGWVDLDQRPCQAAAQVGEALRRRGWPGTVLRCRPLCPAFSPLAS